MAVAGGDVPLLKPDGVPYVFGRESEETPPIVAIGDLHGNLRAFLSILVNTGLIDQNANWIGGKTHLVIDGDAIDGQHHALPIIDLMMKLEKQAQKAGGNLHFNLGNHEVLALMGANKKDLDTAQEMLLEDDENYQHTSEEDRAAFQNAKLPQVKWLMNRNMATVIGEFIFVHAGLEDADPNDPSPIDIKRLGEWNSTARAWFRSKILGIRKPPAPMGFVVGLNKKGKFDHDTGPAFTRFYKISFDHDSGAPVDERDDDGPKKRKIQKTLDRLDAKYLVVGHAPNKDGGIHAQPYYSDKGNVIVIDSHMAFGGKPTAMIYDPSGDRVYLTEISPTINKSVVDKLFSVLTKNEPISCEELF